MHANRCFLKAFDLKGTLYNQYYFRVLDVRAMNMSATQLKFRCKS